MPGIHVAMNFDDGYWAPAYAVMRSVCLSTLRRKEVVFHLVHSPLAPEHQKQLGEIETEFGASVRHHDPQTSAMFRELIPVLPTSGRYPPIIFARLFLDSMLPPEAERVIYLDCDTLVRRPIEELFFIDMHGRPLAAVADPYHDMLKLGRDIRTHKTPFDAADRYFNSGVMLIDLAEYRAADVPAQIRAMDRDMLARFFVDQDVLNFIFRGNWCELDWRFNAMLPRAVHEIMGVAIFHFSHDKPWIRPRRTAFGRLYRHVMTNRVFYWYRRERLQRRLPMLLRGLIQTLPSDLRGAA